MMRRVICSTTRDPVAGPEASSGVKWKMMQFHRFGKGLRLVSPFVGPYSRLRPVQLSNAVMLCHYARIVTKGNRPGIMRGQNQ